MKPICDMYLGMEILTNYNRYLKKFLFISKTSSKTESKDFIGTYKFNNLYIKC